jgi:hypothetical protein
MPEPEFKLETTFTDKSNARWVALAAAVLLLVAIVATMTTSIPEQLLPINDVSLRALIPTMPDGTEPLSLNALAQDLKEGRTLHVSGKIENRSETDIRGLIAVLQPEDYRGFPLQTIEVPVEPEELLAFEGGAFETTVELDSRPGALRIRFKLANGPFVPHRDDRFPEPPPQ